MWTAVVIVQYLLSSTFQPKNLKKQLIEIDGSNQIWTKLMKQHIQNIKFDISHVTISKMWTAVLAV